MFTFTAFVTYLSIICAVAIATRIVLDTIELSKQDKQS